MKQEYPATTGHLVAIGGAEDKTSDLEILRRVIELAPDEQPEVAVIVTASGVPQDVYPEYVEAFGRLGASAVHALDYRDRPQALEEPQTEIIERCSVIFFSGGDQMRLTNVLGGSPVLEAIRERYLAGCVIAGTSAGAVALSASIIYGNGSVDALHKGAIQMGSGLGFVDRLFIDSHFLERGRFTRLMEAGATNPEHLGIGLGEDAGAIIHTNRVLEAIGPGHVIIVDSRHLGNSNVADASNGDPVTIENVIMHALISGYGYAIDERRYLDPAALRASLGEDE